MRRDSVSPSSARPQLAVTPDTTPQELCAFAKTIPEAGALRAKKTGSRSYLYAGPVGHDRYSLTLPAQALQKESAKFHLAAQLVGYVLRHIEARDDTVVIDGAKLPKAKATLLNMVAVGSGKQGVDEVTGLLEALVDQDAGRYGKQIGKVERSYGRFQKASKAGERMESDRELILQYLLESLETILASDGDDIDWPSAITQSVDFIGMHIETLEQPASPLSIPGFLDAFCQRWASAREEGEPLCSQLPFALLLDDVAAMVLRRVKEKD
jgi:hypothetical protein